MARGDDAKMHVLEAVLVILVMFGGVMSVTVLQPSGQSSLREIERMRTVKARDLVNLWNEMPDSSDHCQGTTSRLERLAYDALLGDDDLWDDLTDKMLGPGYLAELSLDNHHDVYPLHGTGRLIGSGASVDWWPAQTYTLPTTRTNLYGGSETMIIETPAIRESAMLRTRGEAMRTSVTFRSSLMDAERVSWAPTALLTESGRSGAGTLAWSTLSASPQLLTVATTNHIREAEPDVLGLFLRVDPAGSSSDTIPAGTTLTIRFPTGWRGMGWDDEYVSAWTNTSAPQVDGQPYELTAEATVDIPLGDPVAIRAYAPANPDRRFDVITAQLGGGSLGRSGLVVMFPSTSTDYSTPRVITPTTPYPVRAGTVALFGVALANGGDAINVTSVDFEIPGGYDLNHSEGNGAPLFASVDNSASYPDYGWELVDSRHVRWTRPSPSNIASDVVALGAEDWIAAITITSDPTVSTDIEPVTSNGPEVRLEFSNGHVETGSDWGGSPGIVRLRVPPDERAEGDILYESATGYPWLTAPVLGAERTMDSRVGHQGIRPLTNDTSYGLATGAAVLVDFENAAANASFEVESRKVPVGSMMAASGDLSSLIETLGALELTSQLSLELYAPPTLGCTPTRKWSIESASLPTPKITKTLVWEAGTGLPTVFAGSEDGFLYRLGEDGEPIWRTETDGIVSALERMELGAAANYLAVGTSTGNVQVISAASGEVVWTKPVHELGLDRVIAVGYDTLHDRVLAAAGQYVATFDPLLGTPGPGARLASDVLDVQVGHNGLLIHREGNVSRYGEELDAIKGLNVEVTGALLGHFLITASGTEVNVYDPAEFTQARAPIALPREVLATARGDATTDGAADLVIVLGDHSIYVIDGNAGTVAWIQDPPYSIVQLPAVDQLVHRRESDVSLPHLGLCEATSNPPTWYTTLTCGGDASTVANVIAGEGYVTLATNALTYATVTHSKDEIEAWSVLFEDSEATALSTGTWGAFTHAVAYGGADGTVVVIGDAATHGMTSTPSERAGRFTFFLRVPEGGFYGTHLLVARLSWDHPTFGHQEARLMDWFEVVAQNGEPVRNPTYRLGMIIDARDDPLSP